MFLLCNQPLFFQFIALICYGAFLRSGFFCILFLISYRYELILFRSFSDQEWLIIVIALDIFQIILDSGDQCLLCYRLGGKEWILDILQIVLDSGSQCQLYPSLRIVCLGRRFRADGSAAKDKEGCDD